MIKVTRMNGQEFYVNAELVEFVEATPDTVITLTTGRKFVLNDTVDDVVQRIMEYRKAVGARLFCREKEEDKGLVRSED